MDMVKILFLGIFIAFLLLIGPWLMIWSVNTLVQAGGVASFNIPFTFWTWLAAACLGGFSIIGRSSN